MYIDILKVLAQRGPLKLTHIMYKANVNCSVLGEYLTFLIQKELVEERKVKKNRTVYAITQGGITLLKSFGELTRALPIIIEEQKRVPPIF